MFKRVYFLNSNCSIVFEMQLKKILPTGQKSTLEMWEIGGFHWKVVVPCIKLHQVNLQDFHFTSTWTPANDLPRNNASSASFHNIFDSIKKTILICMKRFRFFLLTIFEMEYQYQLNILQIYNMLFWKSETWRYLVVFTEYFESQCNAMC